MLVLALWGLRSDVRWIAQPFYAWAWWGYIFLLDGIVALRRGRSLLTRRPGQVLLLVFWSTSFWFFFELLNLRFQNWYYVGVFVADDPLELLLCGAFVLAAFGTVFVGIFETCDALAAFGAFARWRARPRRLPAGASWCIQLAGVAMVCLSLAFPRYLAPLVWGSLTFIVDPWNYRHGARSVLRDVERGDWGLFARVFTAGLICGLVWESLNFFAPQKWIYTVRGLEELKLFEMPLLGFLGFPALAFDALAAFAFISYWLHGNQTWEDAAGSPGLEARPTAPRWAVAPAMLLQLPLWAGVNAAMMDVNIGSFELSLDHLPSISSRARCRLEEMSVRRPPELLRLLREEANGARLEAALELSPRELELIRDEVELFALKGIGARHGLLLERAGVARIADLAGREPEELHPLLVVQAGALGVSPPRLEMVRVWVLAARSRTDGDT
jgi:hypothetical protein